MLSFNSFALVKVNKAYVMLYRCYILIIFTLVKVFEANVMFVYIVSFNDLYTCESFQVLLV